MTSDPSNTTPLNIRMRASNIENTMIIMMTPCNCLDYAQWQERLREIFVIIIDVGSCISSNNKDSLNKLRLRYSFLIIFFLLQWTCKKNLLQQMSNQRYLQDAQRPMQPVTFILTSGGVAVVAVPTCCWCWAASAFALHYFTALAPKSSFLILPSPALLMKSGKSIKWLALSWSWDGSGMGHAWQVARGSHFHNV